MASGEGDGGVEATRRRWCGGAAALLVASAPVRGRGVGEGGQAPAAVRVRVEFWVNNGKKEKKKHRAECE